METVNTWLHADAFPEYRNAFAAGILFFVFTVFGCLITSSPYGKLQDSPLNNFAISLNPRIGWFLMEFPATLSFSYFFWTSPNCREPLPLFLAALWYLHYGNRGFFFPFTIRVAPGTKTNFSFIVVLVGWLFTSLHGYLSANWYGRVGLHLTGDWTHSPIFICGLVAYQLSFWLTVYHEHIQRNLRSLKPKTDEPRYKIPRGSAFELCSNPTYFFELTGWLAFAVMSLNPGGVVVFLVSCANLIPRAFQQHAWYQKTFGQEYPKQRKVLIPFVL